MQPNGFEVEVPTFHAVYVGDQARRLGRRSDCRNSSADENVSGVNPDAFRKPCSASRADRSSSTNAMSGFCGTAASFRSPRKIASHDAITQLDERRKHSAGGIASYYTLVGDVHDFVRDGASLSTTSTSSANDGGVPALHSKMGVSIGPGLIALTRMRWSFSSAVQVRTKERTAALVAL